MFTKILIANRGEIACRIIRTARQMGIKTVAVYSDADKDALHSMSADEAICVGPPPATESYLLPQQIIAAAQKTGADAVHPGYGFLSENPDFVDALAKADIAFIGPSAAAIRAMGLKDAAKAQMHKAGVPVVPGYHGTNQDTYYLEDQAADIGFPLLIKARAGGGGKGMRLVQSASEFQSALASAKREAAASFGDDHVLIEKFIQNPRHIEVQVFGDSHGNAVHFFERDCSLQRRHQKVIEEAPAPGMTAEMRHAMTGAAIRAAQSINYCGAGTVEFIVDGTGPLDPKKFWFMEMNTRLQVEHPVTEAVTGTDLVEWQLRVAAGEPLPCTQEDIDLSGHAFEARIYAEDPDNGFLPASGKIHHLNFGPGRVDTAVRPGDTVTPFYDPMIAKLITHGTSRDQALAKLREGLGHTHIAGLINNTGFLARLADHPEFVTGNVDTGLIEREIEALTSPPEPHNAAVVFAAICAMDLAPETARTGWRHWGTARHRLRLHGEAALSVEVSVSDQNGLCVATETTSLQNVTRDGHTIIAVRNGEKLRADVVKIGELVSVNFAGETREYRLHDPMAQTGSGFTDTDAALAPMTGIVRMVDCRVGQQVKQGDRLLVLEAMKMEHALTAPRDGTIAEIACETGAAVDGGVALVRFAPNE